MMEQSENSRQLIRYVEGELPEKERAKLEIALAASPALQTELSSLLALYEAIDSAAEVSPSLDLDVRFYAMLDKEKALTASTKKSPRIISLRLLAAAITLLLLVTVGGLWQFKQQQQRQINLLQAEVIETQKMLILSMLQHASASDRLQAVNVSLDQHQMDDQIVGALAQALNYDENVNVRLKAVEALSQFLPEDRVLQVFIESLSQQAYPQVQIALIEALTLAKKKEAVTIFQGILEREDLMDIVKDKAAAGIGVLL
ncbi:MAG: HEAT repeat domain-containing protein [Saprospiraceae bacterium]